MKDKEITPVLFRVWKTKPGGVLALFPTIGEGSGRCSSYERVGQHGQAHLAGCIHRTRPAKPAEYADLKRELERNYGYRFKVYRRRPPSK